MKIIPPLAWPAVLKKDSLLLIEYYCTLFGMKAAGQDYAGDPAMGMKLRMIALLLYHALSYNYMIVDLEESSCQTSKI